MKKSKLWSGLTSVFAVLLVICLLGQNLALANASYINTALGVSSSKVVETGETGDTTYFKSSFGSFDDPEAQAALLAASFEQNINEMREGATLMYNNGALPLTDAVQVSVFGHAAVDPMYQGSSAGTKVADGDLNVINLKTALENEGFEVNEALWNALASTNTTRSTGEGGFGGGKSVTGSAANTEENKAFYEGQRSTWADGYKDAAIVVFTREGAEGTDMLMQDTDDDGVTPMSSLALHQNEKDLLELVRSEFDTVIVLLNSPYQMEVHEILPYCDAMMFIGTPGHQGFVGVAELLRGTVNPSGHLVDTYATSSLSAPATVNSGTNTPQFANVDEINATIDADERAEYISFQAENIYIGYRYYETRYADCVMGQGNAADPAGALDGAAAWNYADEVQFTFGHGLSYTTFEQTLDSVDVGEDQITVTATVTNTGSVAGKSVVQLYAQTPYGDYEKEHKVEKSAIQLAGFAKTQLLDPGASETVTITVDKYLLASYDSTAHDGEGGYILSDGDYYLAIGDDCHDALNNILAAQGYTTANGMTADGNPDKSYTWNQSFDDEKYRLGENGVTVSNQFEDCDLNYWIEGAGTYLSRSDWAGTYPVEQTTVEATQEMMDILDGEWYEKPEDAPTYAEVAANFGVDSGLNLAMMKDVPLSDRETWLKFIYQLEPEDLPNATAESFESPAVGNLSPAFGVGDGCDSVGGTLPFTVEFNGEEVNPPTTRYCSKIILTATFNTDLYANRGKMMGEDGLWSGFMINYSLGADLHRTPFGGRNYEYMSECPIMSYLAGIPETEAMEATGSHMGAKHFAGNDQEFYRDGVACFFTEQAWREGNLRAFEGAVREAGAGGIMQSFERLGLKWASASKAMNTAVLRNEWGWNGAIDTDAAPCFDEYTDGGYRNHAAEVLDAGTQEWCLDAVAGHGNWVLQKAKDTDDGHLLELLQEAAISWEYAISRSGITNGISASAVVVHVTPWWQTAILVAIIASAVLTAACFVMLVVSKVKKGKKA
ncbi:glycoside hydrolase family 3 C-terminal domain-containing protein [uncultured Gemmiger sp.]|uniref:glycoside hydrolase family 3 C-terminal domain-containing protein n=1 Tax=uncultured Gemmiger sp. TaxID=1623490 RepID=UPI0025FA583D|nr:glycoside hydrolase family 3 C-terminal domain-containing protein [uncultured Gemmiger sp.]